MQNLIIIKKENVKKTHICITFYEQVKSSLSQELFPKKNKNL